MSAALPRESTRLPVELTALPPAGDAVKSARLPKGVALKDSARDALFVLSPEATSLLQATRELPSAEDAASFARVFIHPEAARENGMLAKLLPRKAVPLAIRASALLARGYKDIEAAEIDGLAWISGAPGP